MKTPGIFQAFVKTITAMCALAALFTPAGRAEDVVAGKLAKGPLKIFLLAGQSNMEGHATLPTIDFRTGFPNWVVLLL